MKKGKSKVGDMLEKAAELLMSCFRVCASDTWVRLWMETSPWPITAHCPPVFCLSLTFIFSSTHVSCISFSCLSFFGVRQCISLSIACISKLFPEYFRFSFVFWGKIFIQWTTQILTAYLLSFDKYTHCITQTPVERKDLTVSMVLVFPTVDQFCPLGDFM